MRSPPTASRSPPIGRTRRSPGASPHWSTNAMRKETEMARRLMFAFFACTLLLTAGAGRAAHGTQCQPAKQGCFELVSTIPFSSNRDNLAVTPLADGADIYLMNPDGTNVRRL